MYLIQQQILGIMFSDDNRITLSLLTTQPKKNIIPMVARITVDIFKAIKDTQAGGAADKS